MTASLVFFEVTGNYLDVEDPDTSGSSNVPAQEPISGVVTIYPRVPVGTTLYVADLDLTAIGGTSGSTAVAMAPIRCRILSGILQTIDVGDTVGIKLLANSDPIAAALTAQIPAAWLQLHHLDAGDLIYDIQFSNIVYGEAAQVISNFAIAASTDTTAICITDPGTTQLPYFGP